VQDFPPWERISNWIAGGAAILAGLVWGDVRKRIADLERKVDEKVDVIAFDKRGLKIDELTRHYHETSVTIARFAEQLARLVSDADSEKETRKRSNEAIMREFGEVKKSIQQRAARERK
jgi:hypothetical protein